MPQSRGKYQFWKESSLSQQLSSKDPIYKQLAGSDPETSKTIGILTILGQHGILNLKDPNISLLMDILNVTRKALFATSEKTNEITKMGLQMPKAEDVYFGDSD